jgi:hypothetical protein
VNLVAAGARAGRAGSAAWAGRASAAIPVVTVFVWAALVHGWEAWSISTPWLFTDELEFTQLSRAIAETGHPARRGVEYPWTTLYVVLTAPAWLIRDTETAYNLAKFLGAVFMSAAALPAYGLARMLVSRGPALFAAVATVAVPYFLYAGLLIQEPLAYLWSTLALYLIVRSLARPNVPAIALAGAVVIAAPFVRGQLAVLVPVYVLAALWVIFRSERGRRIYGAWARAERLGAVLLGIGVLVVANGLLAHRSEAWEISTRHYKDRIVDHALWAGGALAIGIGLLPMVVGLAVAAGSRARTRSPELTAFAATMLSAVFAFVLYAGIKGAFLSTVYGTRVVERNVFYLAPLLFVGTAVWLERPRLRLVALAASTVTVALLLATANVQLEYPYFEAPGFSIATLANRSGSLTQETIERGLYAALAVAVALAAIARTAAGIVPVRRALAGLAALVVLAWNAAGEVTAVQGSQEVAHSFARSLPRPLDWVDRASGDRPVLYLAQKVTDPTGLWSHEFWNRSIRRVWSLDGTAPGPGPTNTPDVVRPDGTLGADLGDTRFVLVEGNIDLDGRVVAERAGLRLIGLERGPRVRSLVEGVFGDGWMGAVSGYSRYSTPGGAPGTVVVTLSRVGGGAGIRADVEVRVGTLVFDQHRQPQIGRVTGRRRWQFGNRSEPAREFAVPTPPPPFRVEVSVDPTFVPHEVDARSGDLRSLGAQVNYLFRTGR